MRRILAPLFCFLLVSCASTTASLDAQTAAASDAVAAAASAALAAHNAGIIKSGTPIEADITIALNAGQAALDNADKQLAAGNTAAVSLYLSEAAAAITQVSVDIAKAKAGGS